MLLANGVWRPGGIDVIKARRKGVPANIGFLLLQDFSMLAFTSCVEPMQMANQLSGQPLYRWQLIGVNTESVKASNGIVLSPECSLNDANDFDAVFVCAGHKTQLQADEQVVSWLCRAAQRGIVLGAVSSGAYLLARAEALDDVPCTVHWKYVNRVQKAFPKLMIKPGLFDTCANRYTSAGGTSALDMFLHEIGSTHGTSLALGVADQFNYERIRHNGDRARALQSRRLSATQPKLAEATTLMEATIGSPLPVQEIADRLRLARPRLDEMFRRHFYCDARRYYLNLRLAHARQLLHETARPVADIARDCGFSSASHFSRRYKARYQHSPRHERVFARPAALSAASPMAQPLPAG
jgi:transcriptional regulator GlxA family with amidase domain